MFMEFTVKLGVSEPLGCVHSAIYILQDVTYRMEGPAAPNTLQHPFSFSSPLFPTWEDGGVSGHHQESCEVVSFQEKQQLRPRRPERRFWLMRTQITERCYWLSSQAGN